MEKLKQNMASIVTLIAMIGAIGGGFIKYGEIVTKLDQLEAREYTVVQTVDLDPVHTRINELTTKVNTNILKAENELFSSRLDEMYIKNSNPLIQ